MEAWGWLARLPAVAVQGQGATRSHQSSNRTERRRAIRPGDKANPDEPGVDKTGFVGGFSWAVSAGFIAGSTRNLKGRRIRLTLQSLGPPASNCQVNKTSNQIDIYDLGYRLQRSRETTYKLI